MPDFLTQEPRSGVFYQSDLSDAAESANYHALEHAGRDHHLYVRFLRDLADQLRTFASDVERNLPLEN